MFIYGLSTFSDQPDAKELCASNITMCAICDSCEKWQLNSACDSYRLGWVFDNGSTVFFALFMSLWAEIFLEFWKRKTAVTAFEWDVRELQETEPQRPRFRGTERKPDPVTGILQRFYPSSKRQKRIAASIVFLVLMLTLVIWSVLGSIVFRLAVRRTLFESSNENIRTASASITTAAAAVIQLAVIFVLAAIYERLAVMLTDWENHEKQSAYE